MNITRIALSALGAFVAYFALGGLAFGMGPLRAEFAKYPTIYRPQEAIKRVMPLGMVAMFVSMVVLAVLHAMLYKPGAGIVDGLLLGSLIGVFAVCAFVIHNYVNLNIGLKLTVQQGVAYFVEWAVAGAVIGAIYKPV